MTLIGYHASHEQVGPRELLECVRLAERAGFSAAMCSDHLFPWLTSHRDGVGFAWAWLGAALEATSSIEFGVVSAPGQRYHPVMLAQAAATLEQMYPGRFWLAVGSGEAVNEHVTGDRWPDKPAREARLRECVDIMRRLWSGETVTHAGLVHVDRARVYSTSDSAPPLFAAAVTPETAEWAGGWADGLVTINGPVERMREVVDAFAAGGGGGKPVRLQYHLSWALTREQAREQALDQWRQAGLRYPLAWDLAMPEDFSEASAEVRVEDLVEQVAIESDLDWHAARLAEAAELGFDQILVHNVGRNQREFIEVFGESVLSRVGGGVQIP